MSGILMRTLKNALKGKLNDFVVQLIKNGKNLIGACQNF